MRMPLTLSFLIQYSILFNGSIISLKIQKASFLHVCAENEALIFIMRCYVFNITVQYVAESIQ